jgi:hypothetical protein
MRLGGWHESRSKLPWLLTIRPVILRIASGGGMGSGYRARDSRLGRDVTIKGPAVGDSTPARNKELRKCIIQLRVVVCLRLLPRTRKQRGTALQVTKTAGL